MSPLQMFLPASEPARSEALAHFLKTHQLPRHLVRGLARGGIGKRGGDGVVQQMQQQQEVPSPGPLDDDFRFQVG
ncbi:hypothetical protein QTH87_08445 [Variovorax sp. J22P168]|uniref:hypothetical protein n=1 Tax=Variovorax jilinensis TaxID=3053513 RepID=UPI00257586FC|nr:hypothetical protein [Variovorax sp. J22P168]MDM0012460.1 hypothetical protein [Variovorax sp. J22P168]